MKMEKDILEIDPEVLEALGTVDEQDSFIAAVMKYMVNTAISDWIWLRDERDRLGEDFPSVLRERMETLNRQIMEFAERAYQMANSPKK